MNRKSIFTLFAVAGLLLMLVAILLMPQQQIQAQGLAVEGDVTPLGSVGRAFTYQGRLTDGGGPANGTYDFQFKLFDAANGNGQVGGAVTVADRLVTDGRFTVQLDFGNSRLIFTGDARWLEIGVRPGNSNGAYTTLSPRHYLAATPYALSLKPGAQIIGKTGLAPALTAKNKSVMGHGLTGQTDADTTGSGVYGAATSSSGQVHGVWGESNSESGYGVYGKAPQFGVYGEASRTGNFAYGVYGKSHSTSGAAGYFANEADGIDIFAAGSGIIRSQADSVLHLSPHDMVVRGSPNVSVTPMDNGGADIYYWIGGWKYLSIPVSTFGSIFGSPVYIKAIKVCYKTDSTGHISATAVLKNNGGTGATHYILSNVDRTNNNHSCYTLTAASPKVIDNSTWVQFNVWSDGIGHTYIYTVDLTLTEMP